LGSFWATDALLLGRRGANRWSLELVVNGGYLRNVLFLNGRFDYLMYFLGLGCSVYRDTLTPELTRL